MFTVATTPLRYLGSYVVTFVAGVAATYVWQWYGRHMRDVGQREAVSLRSEHQPGAMR